VFEKTKQGIKPITQEHCMGCAVACTAFLLGLSYQKALLLFKRPDRAATDGFYCRDIVFALNKAGFKFSYCEFTKSKKNLIKMSGVVVFVKKSKNYPLGHYLVKTEAGWMNPWINYPQIKPARSGFQRIIPGLIAYIIMPKHLMLKQNNNYKQ
jgi:hypothetical protein